MENKQNIESIVDMLRKMDAKSLALISSGAEMLVNYQKLEELKDSRTNGSPKLD